MFAFRNLWRVMLAVRTATDHFHLFQNLEVLITLRRIAIGRWWIERTVVSKPYNHPGARAVKELDN